MLAYLLLPALWRHYEHHRKLSSAPKVTVTADGIPGDPLNVGLLASEKEAVTALVAAGWLPADHTTLDTSLRLVESVLLRAHYPTAPMSELYLFGRSQDLSFEKPVPGGPRRRHHVRFWRCDGFGKAGRPLWLGAATFDRRVGLSYFTGQVTHHISADVDSEREQLIADLAAAHQVLEIFQVTGCGATLWGRNGGGDRYRTDGELSVAVISPANRESSFQPFIRDSPAVVQAKNELMRRLLGR